jgi:hypothetical protein
LPLFFAYQKTSFSKQGGVLCRNQQCLNIVLLLTEYFIIYNM